MSNYKSINKNNTGNGNNNHNNNNENNNTDNNNISSNSYTQKFKQQKKRYKNSSLLKKLFSCHSYYHNRIQLLHLTMLITNYLKFSVKKVNL